MLHNGSPLHLKVYCILQIKITGKKQPHKSSLGLANEYCASGVLGR